MPKADGVFRIVATSSSKRGAASTKSSFGNTGRGSRSRNVGIAHVTAKGVSRTCLRPRPSGWRRRSLVGASWGAAAGQARDDRTRPNCMALDPSARRRRSLAGQAGEQPPAKPATTARGRAGDPRPSSRRRRNAYTCLRAVGTSKPLNTIGVGQSRRTSWPPADPRPRYTRDEC